MNVGIIGLGMMGSQLALRLAQKGHKVTVFNRDKSKIERLLRTTSISNLNIADKPVEIGDSCDIAIICVKDYEAVANVSFEKGGLIETRNTHLVVMQCSTISPDESSKVADLYSNSQIKMISVPILGGVTAAEKGELTLIAAGAKAAYDQTEPILKDLSIHVFYVGSTHRTASALKLAVNINIALIAFALTEALVFVRGNEIDPDIFVRIFNSTYFKTQISENKGPKIVKDDYPVSFSLENMVKDLDLAIRTASISDLTLPATASAHAAYRASDAFGLSNKDYTSVASFILKLNGFNTFARDGNYTHA
jgi:3-hydroxyisobutyrate dehydrogenase